MIRMVVQPGVPGAMALTHIKLAIADHPGNEPVTIECGTRTLQLGPEWEGDDSPELVAKLGEYGSVRVD